MNKKLAKEIYEDGYVEGYKASIVEFLRDWRWGNMLEEHMYRHILVRNCSCPHPKQIYWKWFEKKWEGKK